jgi:hypothetical protein
MINESDVIEACRTIFGKDVNISRDFLYASMQPSGVKSAYRKRAKETHPDLFTNDPIHVQQKQTALFRDILRAYDTLILFFKQRDQPFFSHGGQRDANRSRSSRPESAARTHNHSGTFYTGMIPSRILQIGQYLYYRGEISFSAMINALVWQRRQRPSIGDIAVLWGWLDSAGLNRILMACTRPRLFGEKAVELGLLTVFQVNSILLYQRTQQSRLGDYFIQQGVVSATLIDRLVSDLKEHNAAILASRSRTSQKQRVHA